MPQHDGLFVAGGYNGTGNLNGFTAGRILSELLATGESADARLYDSARPLRHQLTRFTADSKLGGFPAARKQCYR